tara:strand:- start:326 stop:940 length:615 start_codon:yes stop_codon:yes gene_type:complete
MAYWNIDDSATETPQGPNGWVAGVDNNHGDIRYCGTISDTNLWTSTALGEGNPIITVVEATGVGTTGVQTTTAFNLNGSGTAVIMRASTEIGDIPNTVLVGGDSNSANAAFTPLQEAVMRVSYYKSAVLNLKWNQFTGKWILGYPESATSGAWSIVASADQSATMRASKTDSGVNVTQDRPGQLVYQFGTKVPKQDEYNRKYNW